VVSPKVEKLKKELGPISEVEVKLSQLHRKIRTVLDVDPQIDGSGSSGHQTGIETRG
jgi:hypothetical protein